MDPQPHPSAGGDAADAARIQSFVRSLRRRLLWLGAVELMVLVSGAGGLLFVGAAWLVGPFASLWQVGLAWLAVFVALTAGLVVGLRRRRASGTNGPLNLLSRVHVELPSSTLTALQLSRSLPPGASVTLAGAHVKQVAQRLRGVEPRQLAPWSQLNRMRHRIAIAAALSAGLVMVCDGRAQAGARSLIAPLSKGTEGLARGHVLRRLEVRVVYPSYMQRESVSLVDPEVIPAPRGATLEIHALPLRPCTRAELHAGDRQLVLRAAAEGFAGDLVVRDSHPLEIRVEHRGRWLTHASTPMVEIAADLPPEVGFAGDAREALVELGGGLRLPYVASDDVGIESVDLHVRTPAGRELRQRLWTRHAAEPVPQVDEVLEISPARWSAAPGDTLLIWLEARDGDVVSGPHVARSATFSIHVASPATRRSLRLAQASRLLDRGVDVLADRLEQPVPRDGSAAQGRMRKLAPPTREWLHQLDTLLKEEREQPALGHLHRLEPAGAELTTLLEREVRLHRPRPAPFEARQAHDARSIAAWENHLLRLADILHGSRVEDVGAAARELAELRSDIAELLQALRETPSPEAQRELLSEVARAQRRMRELREKLAQLAQDVPGEFVNTEALAQEMPEGSFEGLREAIERGDLDEAAQQLAALDRELSGLARGLEDDQLRFAASRFGEEDRVRREAAGALRELSMEQAQLAEDSRALAQRALDRAGGNGQTSLRQAAEQASSASQALQELRGDGLGPFHDEVADRAQDRLDDVEAALRSGDLMEARRNANQAHGDLEDLSRQLQIDAQMFPGHDHRTAAAAEQARQTAESVSALRSELEQANRAAQSMLEHAERGQLGDQAAAQQRLRAATEGLAERLENEGATDQGPLVPQLREGLADVSDQMGDAEQMLREGRAGDATAKQRESAQTLEQLHGQLDRRPQDGAAAGGPRPSGNAQGGLLDHPVEIPGRDAFKSPVERRRRLLDAMREEAPRGYRGSLARYYEELLR